MPRVVHATALTCLLSQVAAAQPEGAGSETPRPVITIGAYVEAFYQLHLQNPTNRLTNLRGFDNRSRTFTLSNVALDVKGETGPVTTRIVLQIGHTGSTYYLAETTSPGSSGTNASSSELWKYVQTATVAGRAPHGLLVEAGLFPSPIGPEVFAIKDNLNWSRSNLFFGLPFYHTGARVSRSLGGGWTGTLAVYNGWNTVVDNNGYPSIAASAAYASDRTTAQVLYFGGIERPTGAPEGKPWRHLVDALVQYAIDDRVTVAAQLDGGIEPNDIGTSSWVAAAGYGKLTFSDEVYLALRADYFLEKPDGAAALFWPVPWVASGTATLAYQPVTGVSLRAEYRHDHADGDAYFGGSVATSVTNAFVPNRDRQDTATAGVTAWF